MKWLPEEVSKLDGRVVMHEGVECEIEVLISVQPNGFDIRFQLTPTDKGKTSAAFMRLVDTLGALPGDKITFQMGLGAVEKLLKGEVL